MDHKSLSTVVYLFRILVRMFCAYRHVQQKLCTMYAHMCVYTCVRYMGLSKRDFLNAFIPVAKRAKFYLSQKLKLILPWTIYSLRAQKEIYLIVTDTCVWMCVLYLLVRHCILGRKLPHTWVPGSPTPPLSPTAPRGPYKQTNKQKNKQIQLHKTPASY